MNNGTQATILVRVKCVRFATRQQEDAGKIRCGPKAVNRCAKNAIDRTAKNCKSALERTEDKCAI